MNKYDYDSIRLIGLIGKAGSGKDTFAKELGWESVAYADALKQFCIDYLGCTHDDIYTQEGKMRDNPEWGMTNREILQRVGTEAMRCGFHKDVWVKILKRRVQKLLDEGKKVVVTDCRFENECQMVEDLGGILIEITRDGEQGNLTASEKQHPSEQTIDRRFVTFTVENNGTVEEMMLDFTKKFADFSEKILPIQNSLEKGCEKGLVKDGLASKILLESGKYLASVPDNIFAVEGGVTFKWQVKMSPEKIFLYFTDNEIIMNSVRAEGEGDYFGKLEYGDAEAWKEANHEIQVCLALHKGGNLK